MQMCCVTLRIMMVVAQLLRLMMCAVRYTALDTASNQSWGLGKQSSIQSEALAKTIVLFRRQNLSIPTTFLATHDIKFFSK